MDDSTATPKLQPISNKHGRSTAGGAGGVAAAASATAAAGGGDALPSDLNSTGGTDGAGDFSSSYRGRNYDSNYQRNYRNYVSKNYYQDNFNNKRYHDRSPYNQDYKNYNKRKNTPDDQYRNSSRRHSSGYHNSGYNAYNNKTNNSCQIAPTNLQDFESALTEISEDTSTNNKFNAPIWVQAKATKRAQSLGRSKDSANDEQTVDSKKVADVKSPCHSKDYVKKNQIDEKSPSKKPKLCIKSKTKSPQQKPSKKIYAEETNCSDKNSTKDQTKLPQSPSNKRNKKILSLECSNPPAKESLFNTNPTDALSSKLQVEKPSVQTKDSLKATIKSPVVKSSIQESSKNLSKTDTKSTNEKSITQSKNSLNIISKAVTTKTKLQAPKNKKLLTLEDSNLSAEESPTNSSESLLKPNPNSTVEKSINQSQDPLDNISQADFTKKSIQSKDSSVNTHEENHKAVVEICSNDLQRFTNKQPLSFKKVFVVKKYETSPNTKTKIQNNIPKTPTSKKLRKKKPLKEIVSIETSEEAAVEDNSLISSSSTTDKVEESLQETEEQLNDSHVTPSIPPEVANSESNSPIQSNTKCPKISLIPLSRLIRNELLELTDDNINSVVSSTTPAHLDILNTTPSKLICKPNLVCRRQRNISSCSNSSNTTETIVEKVANMDKMGIKNVINNSGTKYDEALKLQARKRLREEIRKQLKTMNVEQPKNSGNSEFIHDDIVDAIHIPDVVLDEIRKAFGIEFIKAAAMKTHDSEEKIRDIEEKSSENPTDNSGNTNSDENHSEEHNQQSETSITSTYISRKPTNDLMSRLRNADYIKSPKETPTPKEHPQFRFADECIPTNPNLNRVPRLSDRRQSITPDKTEETRKKKISTSKRRRCSSEVIVILSSSSSSNSSSSSSSSSSDSDSDSSTPSVASSVKRRRQKQKVYAENVVDSFEKLILPSISENLAKRYHTKYSNSTNTKLHFISCICVSGYNSEKFSKIEIAKIQRNLKSNDSTNALEFLMREIVNVFNKQKQIAKDKDTNQKSSNLIKPHENKTPTQNAPPDSSKRDDNDDAGCNRIEAAATPQTDTAAAATAIKSKSVDAAEKVIADETEEKYKSMLLRLSSRNREKKSSSLSTVVEVVQQSTPPQSEHQSVNEQTLTKVGVGSKSAGNAKIQKSCIYKSKLYASKTCDETKEKYPDRKTNCISTSDVQSNYETDNDNNINDERYAAKDNNDDKESHKDASFHIDRKQPLDMKPITPFLGLDLTTPSSYCGLDSLFNNISGGSGTSAISAMIQHPSFPTVDLDMLKQQSMFGEIIVSNLRDIDVKLMELHKRKMFIEEMLLKLQKEKMDADLQTIKLQNEKFILLNTAMTANATATATKMEPNIAAAPATELKSEGTNTEAEDPAVRWNTKCSSAKTTRGRRNNNESDEDKKSPAKIACKSNNIKKSVNASKGPGPRAKRKYAKRGEMQRVMNAKLKRSMLAAEVISSDEDTNSHLPVLDDLYLTTPARLENEKIDFIEASNYADLSCGPVEGIRSPITQIRIFEDFIVAAAEDGSLYKFNARTLQLEKQFAKHSEAITQMYLCREKKILYTTSLDGYLKKTSIENFELDIQSLYLQEPLQSIDVQWGVAYVGSRWGNIFTYDIAANKVADALLCSLEASIIAIKATKEGPRKILVVSSKGNMMQFRDASSGLLLRTLDVPEHLHIYSLLLDYGCVYCGTQKNEIYKFDFTTGVRMAILNCGNGAVSMQFYKNKFILVGCYDGLIYVLDKETGERVAQFAGSGKMVLTLELAGDKIITSAKDNTMKVIDIPSHVVALTTA